MYMLENDDDEYTSIDEIIDYVLEKGIDPSETVYKKDELGIWRPIGEVYDFIVE